MPKDFSRKKILGDYFLDRKIPYNPQFIKIQLIICLVGPFKAFPFNKYMQFILNIPARIKSNCV